MAIRFTPWRAQSAARVCKAPSQSLRGSCGKTVVVSTNFPVVSTTATFTPVRIPGSSPMTTRGPAGAANSKSRRLSANTLIATFSASSRNLEKRSRSMERLSFTRQVQATHFLSKSSAARPWWLQPKCSAIRASASETGAVLSETEGSVLFCMAKAESGSTNFTSKMPRARPRKTANARWEGTRPIASSYAK